MRKRSATRPCSRRCAIRWSGLYARLGDGKQADQLAAEADALRLRFNRDYWMAQAGCYCLALDQDRRQVGTVSSNAGHALWCGIADAEKARSTADRLMMPDM